MVYVVNNVSGNELSLQLIPVGCVSHMRLSRVRWFALRLCPVGTKLGQLKVLPNW